MSKVKEIYIECKKSRNFQTHTAGMLLSLEGDEQTSEAEQDMLVRKYQAVCRKAVMDQLRVDAGK